MTTEQFLAHILSGDIYEHGAIHATATRAVTEVADNDGNVYRIELIRTNRTMEDVWTMDNILRSANSTGWSE